MVSALRVLSPALRVAVCACTARITRAHTCATSSVRTASAPALVLTPYSRRPHLHTQRRCERARVQAPCEGHRMSPRSSETLIDSTRRRSERRRRLPGSPCGRVLRQRKAFRASAKECALVADWACAIRVPSDGHGVVRRGWCYGAMAWPRAGSSHVAGSGLSPIYREQGKRRALRVSNRPAPHSGWHSNTPAPEDGAHDRAGPSSGLAVPPPLLPSTGPSAGLCTSSAPFSRRCDR